MLDPHPGGLGFFGPTDPAVPAVWWNAAALGELDGTHLHVSGSPRMRSEQAARGGLSEVQTLEIDPDLFAGVSTDLTTEHVRVAFAYHVPFRDHGSIGKDADVL